MQPLKLLFLTLFFAAAAASGQTNASVITREMALSAEKLIGLEFSDAKLDMLLPGLRSQLEDYEVLHHFALSNAIPPAMMFNPLPVGFKMPTERRKVRVKPAGKVSLPANRDDLAFYSVGQLAVLLKSKQLSSEALTRFYLERLKKYGPRLECVVTLTEDLALQQARRPIPTRCSILTRRSSSVSRMPALC